MNKIRHDHGISTGATRYTLIMLTIAYALNFVDRQILVVLQEPIKADMGLSDAQLGLLSGFSFALVYIIAGIPIAYWADRHNRRNIIALAVTTWSGMTAMSGLAQNYTQLLLARIGVGIGEAGGSPPSHAMISDLYPPEKRATAFATYSVGLHVGVLVGFLVGGFVSQLYGWRIAFMTMGIPGLLFSLIFYLTVKEPVRGKWESVEQKEAVPSLKQTLRLLSSRRSFWYITAGTGLTAFVTYGNGNFTPSFLMRSHGFTVGEVGLVLAAAAGGGGIVGTFLGGYLADRLGKTDKRWYVWVPAIAGTLSMPVGIPYLLLENTTTVIGLLFVVSILLNTYLGPVLAISHAMVPPAMRALTSAVLFFIMNLIGLGLGPLTAGLLSDQLTASYGSDGLRYAMLIISFIGLSGIVMFLLAGRNLLVDISMGSLPTGSTHSR